MLLNAKRSTPPTWDEVTAVVEYCRSRHGPQAPPGLTFDRSWWRLRLDEVEVNATRDAAQAPRKKTPAGRPEAVAYDFADAVEVLAGGRKGLRGLAEGLLALGTTYEGQLSRIISRLPSESPADPRAADDTPVP
ncbi:hypothetical protein [Streptomyces zhihengii]|uniref:hypothetical protein n=1 Tax=Streptomyces zhihengii TaxID=1818004 RepID=UPI0033A3BF82